MPGHVSEPVTVDADWVVTMDGPAIRSGRVVIESSRIVAVGPVSDVPLRGEHQQLGQAVLMPGLINAHCHLELSAHHGVLPPEDLWSWLPKLVMLRLAPGAAAKEQAAVPAAVQSMLAAGTTCVGDISRAAWLPGALAAEPIRKVCYVELINGAMSPPTDMPQLQQRVMELPRDPLLVAGISPHAPYTVKSEDLRACGVLAARQTLPLAIHLAETHEEIEWLRHGTGLIGQWHARFFQDPPGSPRCGPTEYVLGTGMAEAPAAALIHMNHADDWRRIKEIPEDRQPAVVYCPRSHAFFGHTAHPFREMLDAGLVVAVGTDSAASHLVDEAHPLSVLDELRWLHGRCPTVPAETLLRMGTIHGAKALGLTTKVGRIRAGLQADLMAFETTNAGADPLTDLLEGKRLPCFVCVAGRPVGTEPPGCPAGES
jgi:cytosine/adenosine deaminase-related metal-dependent hydrolase